MAKSQSNYQKLSLLQLRTELAKMINHDTEVASIIDNCKYDDKKDNIYIAGPWFSPKDKDIMQYIVEMVNKHKNKIPADIYFPCEHNFSSARQTFEANLDAIDKSDIIIALVLTKDIGTSMEIGYALGKNKMVLLVCWDETDFYNNTNIMISYAGNSVALKLSSLIDFFTCTMRNGEPVAQEGLIEVKDTWEGKQ